LPEENPPAANKEAKMIFRSDNRALDQIRELKLTPNFIRTAEGSCLIEVGNTRVICTATIEETVPGWMRNQGKGWVTSEYGMLPRATLTRTAREASRGKQGGRTLEIQRLIGRSMRAIVDMTKLGERTIWIDCDVIQADGGTRTASITGGFVAMALAMQKLVAAGTLKELPLRDSVAAISAGIVDGEPMLDLAYEEDSRAEVDMNYVLTGTNKFIEIQATAEHEPFSDEQLAQMTSLARKGVAELVLRQREVLSSAGIEL
jgi:ribonuclease PH